MNVDGSKIKALVEFYGRSKGYPEKSYLPKFCEDFDVNYKQWNAYFRGTQNLGTKIFDILMDIFPDLNMNWLLKDDPNMFLSSESEFIINEPQVKYAKNITNSDLMKKLEEIHSDLKRVGSI